MLTPTPTIKNFLVFRSIISCNIPETFLPLINISLGNFKFIIFFLQKFLITSEIIIPLIIENSSNVGKFFFNGKNIDKKRFPLFEIHLFP